MIKYLVGMMLFLSTTLSAESVQKTDKLIAPAIVTPKCEITSALSVSVPGTCNTYYLNMTHTPITATVPTTVPDGQQITLVVYSQSSGRTLNIANAAPGGVKWRFGIIVNSVLTNTYSVYTLMKVNGVLFVAGLDQML